MGIKNRIRGGEERKGEEGGSMKTSGDSAPASMIHDHSPQVTSLSSKHKGPSVLTTCRLLQDVSQHV